MTTLQMNCSPAEYIRPPAPWHRGLRDSSNAERLQVDAVEPHVERRDIGDLTVVAANGSSQRRVVTGPVGGDGLNVLIPGTAGCILEVRGRFYELKARSAYVVDHRYEHVLILPHRFAHLSVVIPQSLAGTARASLKAWDGSPWRLEAGSAAVFTAFVEASFEHARSLVSCVVPIVARSIVELLNAALAEATGTTRAPACSLDLQHRMRIYRHAAKELTDHELSVRSIADAVGLSVRRVHQVFESAELPLMRWVWSERLSQCHGRLLSGLHSGQLISDIAYEWGFNDPAHFSRVYKKRYGHSPSDILKKTVGLAAGTSDR